MTNIKKMYSVNVVLAFIMGSIFIKFMRIPDVPLVWIISVGLMYILINKYFTLPKATKIENICSVVFSALFSMSLVMGTHINVKYHKCKDLMTALYVNGSKYVNLTKYSTLDLVGFVVLFIINVMFFRLLCNLISNEKVIKYASNYRETTGIWKKSNWIIVAIVLFVSWIPYLIYNYPGFILGDSLNSIGQAVGATRLNNHHPIMYTFYIKCCLKLGELIKDRTFGCCIYSITQMIYLSLGLGYLIMWVRKKGAPKFLCILFISYFAFTPYYAQNSIAMWKDPVFSVVVALISTLLFDLIITKGTLVEKKMFWVKYIFFTLLICFLRNNGLYLILFCELFIVIYVIAKKSKEFKKVSICTGIMIVAVWLITGPFYNYKKISGEPVEKLGVFLNQMARVVVYEGNMSKSDKEFMNNILPLNKYEKLYTPASVDRLKFNINFSQEYLDSHLDEFAKTYFSMMVKNPGIYFEAWQLSTFGFWAFNYWEINNCEENITLGSLIDIFINNFGIDTSVIEKNLQVPGTALFSCKGKNISLSIITWIVFLLTALALVKKWDMIIPLTPVLGLIATLLIASPVSVWGRYGLAECYLIPFYVVVVIFTLKRNGGCVYEK